MISSDLACDCAAFTVYASYTRLTPTAMCLSMIALKRSNTLSRSLVVTPSRHSHWSQKSMRIGYSEFCSCYASHAPLSQTYLHTPLKISVNSVVSSAWKKSRSKAYSLSAESISRRYTSSWSFTHTSRLR